MGTGPAKVPCGSCPYRKDVPAGIWTADEYAKLPAYDLPTGEQPYGAFFCHQQDGHLCAGWVGCHDMEHSLGLRMALSMGAVSGLAFDAALDYVSPVLLFESGAVAAAHGMAGVGQPGDKARKVIGRLVAKQERRAVACLPDYDEPLAGAV